MPRRFPCDHCDKELVFAFFAPADADGIREPVYVCDNNHWHHGVPEGEPITP